MIREERLNDPEESLRLAMDGRQAQMWTALPGAVTAVNLDAQTVSVQPTIQGSIKGPDGLSSLVNLPLLVDVPIVWPRAGGFALTFPIKPGDEVLVVFAARCIDSWWQSGGIGAPAEARMHDLSDGFAIPGPTSQPRKLAAVSDTAVQLRNDAGDTYVEITPEGAARVVAASKVDVVAPEIDLTAGSIIKMAAPLIQITGALTQAGGGAATFSGDILVQGNITTPADVVADTISLKGHVHSGVTPGGGNTGTPNP